MNANWRRKVWGLSYPLSVLFLLGVSLGPTGSIGATADNLIVNGSFENPPGIEFWEVFDAGIPVPGWNIQSGTVEIVGTYWQAADGLQALDLNGIFEEIGTIYQNVETVPGERYKIRFAYAGNAECGPAIKTTRVTWNDQELGIVSFDSTGYSPTNMGWTYYEYEVTASSTAGRLMFQSLTSSFCGPAIDDVSVELSNDEPPVIQSISASPSVLWPPNNKRVPVTLTVNATDDSGTPICKIVSVASNEPQGRGNRTIDFQVTGPLTVNLRAARLGAGTGRVYTIVVEAEDSSGQTSRAQVLVRAPHSKAPASKRKS